MIRKKMKISIEEYEKHRNMLLEWKWITEAHDSKTNLSVYKPTFVGTQVYSTIVRLVGTDTLVNNFKLKRPEIESNYVVLSGTDPDSDRLNLLLEHKILTRTIDPETDIEKIELTPLGAKLFIAFFVSNNREIGTLPGDKVAKFFKIMQNMPRYTQTFSEIMDNIGKGFRSLDNSSAKNNFGSKDGFRTPKYNSYDDNKMRSAGDRMMNFNKMKSKSKKSSKSKSRGYTQDMSDKVSDHYSRQGQSMMDDMMKKWK